MKKLIFTFIMLSVSAASLAQRQNTHWYFGRHAHVSFNAAGGLTTVHPGETMPINSSFNQFILEGCATVSDYVSGNLLVYSNGYTVFGSNHAPIANGTGLLGNSSSTQNIVFIPRPNNNRVYYAVTIDGFTGGNNGLFYSEINATTATPFITDGLKNIPLRDNFGMNIDQSYNNPSNGSQLNQSESVTVAKHANGVDYWLVAHVNNFIYVYLVDCNGIGGATRMPSSSYSIPANNPLINLPEAGGAIKISQMDNPNSSIERLAIVVGADVNDRAEVMAGDFNKQTGIITLNKTVASSVPSAYTLEFSKTGNILYYNRGQQIEKFDFSTNQVGIVTGATQLASSIPINPIYADSAYLNLFSMQRGPNDNIYVSIHNNRFLGRINDSTDFSLASYVNNVTGNLAPSAGQDAARSLVGLPQLVPQQAPYLPPTLVAINDAFSLSNASTVTTTATVLQGNPTNPDTMNGNPAVLSGIPKLVVTPIGSFSPTPASGNITLNANGTLTVLAGTTPGTYTLQYQLCTAGSCPVCSNTATVTVVVTCATTPQTMVINDDYICMLTGTTSTMSILNNDTIGGFPANMSNVVINDDDVLSHPGVTLNPNGTITVGTGASIRNNYEIVYSISQSCLPSNYSEKRKIYLIIGLRAIVDNVNTNIAATTVSGDLNVLSNDTYLCNPLNQANVSITYAANPYFSINTTPGSLFGNISITSGLSLGEYYGAYAICETTNSSSCSQSYITVRVVSALKPNPSNDPIKQEITSNTNFKIYPNPTTGIFNIDLEEFSNEQFEVKMYNFLGQQVFSQELLKNNDNQLNISSLQNGNYFVVLSNKKRVIKKMIIKQ